MSQLHLHSTLQDLKLHRYEVKPNSLGSTIYRAFDADAVLPGVVLLSPKGEFCGVLSRRRFLEVLSRPYGRELFLRRPISILHRFTSQDYLKLPGDTPITVAAQKAIARPSEFLYEPIVVECHTDQTPPTYYLLDTHDVLQAQSIVHQLTAELLQEKTRSERIQIEKMASLGKMMAGVAHEIRNPVNFIWGNLSYLEEYAEDLITLIKTLEAEVAAPSDRLRKLQKRIDLDFVMADLPQVLQSMKTGTDRLRNLVTSLRTFSRMDEAKRDATDIHQSLDSTLQILNNRVKLGIAIERQYADPLPTIPCYSGQVGQVFMNIISNAIDALLSHEASLRAATPDMPSADDPLRPPLDWEPRITIITALRDRLPTDIPTPSAPATQAQDAVPDQTWVSICIRDNGPGIPPNIQAKVFDDFFTTKAVGDGTGLGLPITRQIVTEKHGGHLILRSPVPNSKPETETPGTEFEILLPTRIAPAEAPTAPIADRAPLADPPQPGRSLTPH